MSNRNAIPEFTSDPESIATALRAVKEMLEELTGQRPGQSIGAPRVFVQPARPDPRAGVQIKPGDLWIQPSGRRLYFWDGRIWQTFLP